VAAPGNSILDSTPGLKLSSYVGEYLAAIFFVWPGRSHIHVFA
jgi:hypothetical protein